AGFQFSTDTGPVLRFEYHFPTLKGRADIFEYLASEVGVTIDLTPGAGEGKPLDSRPRFRQIELDPELSPKVAAGIVVAFAAAKTTARIIADFMERSPAIMPIVIIAPGDWTRMPETPPMAALPRAPLPALVQYRARVSIRRA